MMEKSNKLKLRRRVFQKEHTDTKRIKSDHSNAADKDNEEETVVLSSDSEAEVDVSTKISKTNTVTVNRNQQRGFLVTSNTSLNNLRKLVLSLTPKDVDISKLSHFPAYNETMKPEVNISLEERLHEIQGRLLPIDRMQQVKELSPFPQVCKHLMKKSQKQRHISSPVMFDDKHNEEVMQVSFESDKASLSKPLENSKDTEWQSANSKGNFSKNGLPLLPLPIIPQLSTSNNSGNTGPQVSCSKNFSGIEIKRNEGKIPKLFDSHGVKSEQSVSKSPTLHHNHTDLPEDNAVLMRDRNSNLYALRCQNKQKSIESRNTDSVTNLKPNITGSKSRNTPESDIGTSLVRDKKGDVHLNTDLTSTNQDLEEPGKEKCIRNNIGSFTDKILNNKMTSRPGVTEQKSESHQSTSNSWNSLQSKSKGNTNIKSSAREESTEKSAEKQHQKNVAEDRVVQEIDQKVQINLQRCPLCQIQFDPSYGQMEIDAHIATCLSNSEDDVMW